MTSQPQPEPATRARGVADWPSGVGFIYIGISPWDGMWKNRHQLMSRFAGQLPVLYVEPWQRLRRLRRSRPSLAALRAELGRDRVTVQAGGVRVFHSPAWLPVSGSSRVRAVTLAAWTRRIRREARKLGISRPVLWVSHPEMGDVVGRMDEILSVYHIVDEYGGYTGAARSDVLASLENRLLDRADLSIAVTPELVAARQAPGRSLMLVENAVDYERFVAALSAGPEPAALAAIPRPRYGYSGLIGVRLDLELLLELARAEPACSLVLAGKVDPRDCEAVLAELSARPNVHFVGQIDVADVPAHVAGFDVGLLPYRLNRETQHISPLKLYEYLAAGKPVVATRIPAAERHGELVTLADTAADFAAAARRVIAADSPALREQRQAFAAMNTWDHRVRQIADALRPLVAEALADGT